MRDRELSRQHLRQGEDESQNWEVPPKYRSPSGSGQVRAKPRSTVVERAVPLYNRALVLVLGDHLCSCATTNVGLTELHKFCFVYASSRPRNSSTGKSHAEASQ